MSLTFSVFFIGVKMGKAKRALPTWVKGNKSTKSGGGKVIKGETKPKKTGGVKGARPGDKSIEAIFDYWGNKR